MSRPTPPPIRKSKPSSNNKRSQRTFKRGRGRRSLPIRKEYSAGGAAVRKDGDNYLVALLKTRHKRGLVWVLPKGHIESDLNETPAEAARREVSEETGLDFSSLILKDQLGITRFKFQVEDAVVYKTVHHYLLTTQSAQLTPQAEEGLLEAAWFPLLEALRKLEYDTDQQVIARAYSILTGRPAPAIPAAKPKQSRRRITRKRRARLPKIH